MSNKKGQAAMEFLMTYGWAILVVLIALGALFYLGVFSLNVANTCTPVAPFSACDIKITTIPVTTEGVALTFPDAVTLVSLEGIEYTTPSAAEDCVTSTSIPTAETPEDYACDAVNGLSVGDTYAGDAVIAYTLEGGVAHTVRMGIVGTVE